MQSNANVVIRLLKIISIEITIRVIELKEETRDEWLFVFADEIFDGYSYLLAMEKLSPISLINYAVKYIGIQDWAKGGLKTNVSLHQRSRSWSVKVPLFNCYTKNSKIPKRIVEMGSRGK